MICYYNNNMRQYFWVKEEFKSTTNCDHLERHSDKDNLHDELARTKKALKVASEAIALERELNCDCGKTTINGEFVSVTCRPCKAQQQIKQIIEGKE